MGRWLLVIIMNYFEQKYKREELLQRLQKNKQCIVENQRLDQLVIYKKENIENLLVTVLPSCKISKSEYDQILSKHETWNKLIIKVCQDWNFLKKVYEDHKEVFAEKLFKLAKVTSQKPTINFGIMRFDYMWDANRGKFVQIKYNMFATPFIGMSQKIQHFHQLNSLLFTEPNQSPKNLINDNNGSSATESKQLDESELLSPAQQREEVPPHPEVHSDEKKYHFEFEKEVENVAKALIRAQELYESLWARKDKTYILIVVDQKDNLGFDLKMITQYILKQKKHSLLVTFDDLEKQIDTKGELLTCKKRLIGVVYYRLADYPNPVLKHWKAFVKLQKSSAINCPNVLMLLANLPKVQAMLHNPRVLANFLLPEEIDLIMEDSLCSWNLQDFDECDQLSNDAKEYVLKPIFERGGRNIYGQEIVPFIQDLKAEEFPQYFIQEKVKERSEKSFILDNNEVLEIDTKSVLGFYYSFIVKKNILHEIKPVGHFVKSINKDSHEGRIQHFGAYLNSLTIQHNKKET